MAFLRLISLLLSVSWVVLCCEAAKGGQIFWSSERLATNVTSSGSPIAGVGFEFELGGFSDGFQPTSGNVDDWAEHWVPVARTAYHAQYGSFAGVIRIDGGEVATAGERGYMWGFSTKDRSPEAEWILMSHSEWCWPASDDGIAAPLEWTTNGATEVIVGSVNPGPGIHLQTAAPFSSDARRHPDLWLATHALDGVDDSQIWDADVDGDGSSNLLEYAAGTDPRNGASRPRVSGMIARYEDGDAMTLTFDKNPESKVHYLIETSTDLKRWADGDGDVAVVESTPERLVVRELDTLRTGESPERFLRLRARLLP